MLDHTLDSLTWSYSRLRRRKWSSRVNTWQDADALGSQCILQQKFCRPYRSKALQQPPARALLLSPQFFRTKREPFHEQSSTLGRHTLHCQLELLTERVARHSWSRCTKPVPCYTRRPRRSHRSPSASSALRSCGLRTLRASVQPRCSSFTCGDWVASNRPGTSTPGW